MAEQWHSMTTRNGKRAHWDSPFAPLINANQALSRWVTNTSPGVMGFERFAKAFHALSSPHTITRTENTARSLQNRIDARVWSFHFSGWRRHRMWELPGKKQMWSFKDGCHFIEENSRMNASTTYNCGKEKKNNNIDCLLGISKDILNAWQGLNGLVV